MSRQRGAGCDEGESGGTKGILNSDFRIQTEKATTTSRRFLPTLFLPTPYRLLPTFSPCPRCCFHSKTRSVYRPHRRQDSVEVVAFVLEQLRQGSFETKFAFLPLFIPVSDPTANMAPDPHQKFRKAHAVVPQLKHLFAAFIQRRVEKHCRFTDVHVDHPLPHTDLRGSDSTTNPIPRSEFHQGVMKIACYLPERSEIGVKNRFRGLIEPRISEQEDLPSRHCSPSADC